ncbi:MAG: hypothetical protein P1P64_03680 [Treponemataceae bacterium]
MKKETDNTIIVFESLPLWMRFFAFFFGILILIANITQFKQNIISSFMILLGAFLFVISLLEDKWTFDMSSQELIRFFGFFLHPAKKRFSFNEVHSVRVYEFEQVITKTKFSEVTLSFKNGKKIKLAYDKTNKIKDLILKANILQDFFCKRNFS